MKELDKLVELPEGVWPDSLMIRDTQIHDDMGGLGQRIYTTAGAGYPKVKYVRADLVPEAGKQSAAGERVDLEQFRPAVECWVMLRRNALAEKIAFRLDVPAAQNDLENAKRLLALIDNQKSGEGEGDLTEAEQQGPEEMSPDFTDSARGAIAWVLWHHQGGSSAIGQPLRFALGMGAHEPLPEWRIAEGKRWAKRAGATTADFHAPNPGSAAHDVVPDPRPSLQYDDEGNGEYNYNEGWNDCRAAMIAAIATESPPIADASKPGRVDVEAGTIDSTSSDWRRSPKGVIDHLDGLIAQSKPTRGDYLSPTVLAWTSSIEVARDMIAALSSPRADVGDG
jgi:hypothetical protein